ncbi:hypothetical protein H6503_05725 [Candidatus Woesearchaeota archaeon]|nr:hypothetical protein [Candidatus Woesearchaeota archaeon]
MKVRKAIKRIMALGTGLTMLGATVFGAVAANLGDYPYENFVKDGKFHGLLVVGEAASTEDVLGVVDIATSLQFSTRREVAVDGSTSTTLSGDVFKFEANADVLEINELLPDVKSTLDSEQLEALGSKVIRNSKGTTDADQYLKFADSDLVVIYGENDEVDPTVVGDWLRIQNGEDLFTYELNFPDGLESDVDSNLKLEDIEDEDLFILGDIFSIVEGTVDSSDRVALTLMGGAVTDTLKEGESKTYEIDGKDYEVTVVIIADADTNSGNPKVKLMINGEVTDTMEDGDTDTLDDGTVIGIRDILANEGSEENGEDIVAFYIGANKIEFGATGTVKIDEDTVSEATVTIDETNSSGTMVINKITYELDSDDDYFLGAGDSLRSVLDEPEGLLSSVWDIKYEGLSQPTTTEVKISPSGDDKYFLEFVNQEGIEYDIPLVENDATNLNLGKDDADLVYTEASATPTVYNASDDNQIMEDDYFILGKVSSDTDVDVANTRVMKFKDSDLDDDDVEITLVDEGTKSTTTLRATLGGDGCNATTSQLNAGGESYNVTVCRSSTSYSLAVDLDGDGTLNGDSVAITTKNNAYIVFDTVTEGPVNSTSNVQVRMNLTITDDYTDTTGDQMISWLINGTVAGDSGDYDEVDVVSVTGNAQANLSSGSDEDSDDTKYMTRYGIMLYEQDDDEGADTLTLTIPSEQVEALVYVTGGDTTASTSSNGKVYAEVQRIEVGKAVLDSEVGNVASDNLIVVGGPCANEVAATLLDISNDRPACYEDFPVPEGQGIIKMVENGDNVAVVVAGYSAADTRNAAQVLANYEDYAEDLDGKDEVVVSGTKVMAAEVMADDAMEDEE